MNFEISNTPKGEIAYCQMKNNIIKTPSEFLEVILNSQSETIIIDKKNIADDFFDLKTGFAGECLQKISNYQRRLIILGDFTNLTSKSLNALIYECNKNGKIIFASDSVSAIELLR